MAFFSHSTSKGPLCSHSILRFRIAIFIKVSYWILWAASILLRTLLCMKYVEDFKIACVIFSHGTLKRTVCSYPLLRFRIPIFIKLTYWIFWAAVILLRTLPCITYFDDFKIACAIFFSWDIKRPYLYLLNTWISNPSIYQTNLLNMLDC